MDKKETFEMTYSAQQQEELQEIRKKYLPQEPDKLERLRQLDASVGTKAMAVSLTVGIVGTLLLGLGMSMVMSDFGQIFGSLAVPLGIGIGLVGLATLSAAYPLYVRTLKKQREKVAPEILKLTDELMQ